MTILKVLCPLKVLTKKPGKRSGFCGNKGKKDTDVNNVNSDDVIENSANNDCGDQNNLSANTSTAPDKKFEPIEVSTSNCPYYITGNRIIDMEILSSIVNMLACPSFEAVYMKVSEIYSKKKGLASFLFLQCHSCSYFIESYTSRSVGNSFDRNTRAIYSMRACGQGYAGLDKCVTLMNLPKQMTANNYDKIANKLIVATKDIAETTMQDA